MLQSAQYCKATHKPSVSLLRRVRLVTPLLDFKFTDKIIPSLILRCVPPSTKYDEAEEVLHVITCAVQQAVRISP